MSSNWMHLGKITMGKQGCLVLAAVQKNRSGIAAVTVEEVGEAGTGMAGTLIEGAYAPVMPWDIKAEEGVIDGRRLPSVIGYAISGTVIGSGPLGLRNAVGRRVISAVPGGSNAQRGVAPLAPLVFTIPDNVSLAQAATVIGGGDAALMLSKVPELSPGDRVVISGANGGVGTWLVQILNLMDVRTDILSSSRSLEICRQLFPSNKVTDDSEQLLSGAYAAGIDLTGERRILGILENRLRGGGTLVTAATPDYRASRSDVNAVFRNRPISPTGYNWLLAKLSERAITAVIDSIYPLQEVRDAQWHVKRDPHKGRTLLRLNTGAES
ncbi:zinc-binding alcohol dehydrogenase family protein [Bifidobacterium crudilactis]|uniref:zinc-binding alcohol dehydrogenase family protein n=1 Tax=Bifidobacterium crudilactis TaxID=327277 RepID=UPI002F34F36E